MAGLARGGGDLLLAGQLLLQALRLVAQSLDKTLELGKLPAALVELVFVDADQAVERAHGVSFSQTTPRI
jgi:hypothetical protein